MNQPKLPPPPRAPRWVAVSRLSPRVALLVISVLLLPIAAVIGLRLKGVDVLGTVDPALDAEHSIVEGVVESVSRFDIGIGDPRVALDFAFSTTDGTTMRGRSFASAGTERSRGDRVTVEFATRSPDTARVQGTRCNPYEPTMSRFIGFVAAPVVFLFLLWLRDNVRRRSLLTNGRETRLIVLETSKSPRAIEVRYRYADQHGVLHPQRMRVARTSRLASELGSESCEAFVVHDELEPDRHRIVLAGDFVS